MSIVYLYVMTDDITCSRYVEWHNKIGLHRDEPHPAVIYVDGDKFWYENGEYICSEEKGRKDYY
jgi:hypothetical protein